MEQQHDLERTPLHDTHVALGARMVAFAGYEMPVQFKDGVLKEHLWVRENAGLFDVSHMGQVIVRARSGDPDDAQRALERLVPVDVLGLAPGRQRYALFTNDTGGILDDLMVANRGDHLLLVVNAACKNQDFDLLKTELSEDCEISWKDGHGLLAIQGPRAEDAMTRAGGDVAGMRFMDVAEIDFLGSRCVVTRSGYTGEDGFEISVPDAEMRAVAEELLSYGEVKPIGLGARDSLRLEAGLCLYGNDIDAGTTPVEADLAWAIQKVRRPGGAREGGFPGADVISKQLVEGVGRRRVGLKAEGRAPVRHGAGLFESPESSEEIGTVTSGGFGPSVGGPVAMGYVPSEFTRPGTKLYGEVRGKRLALIVTPLPFVPQRYKRGNK